MKIKNLFIALLAMVVISACSENETVPEQTLDLNAVAKQTWQDTRFSSTFFENQKNVSHYSFSKKFVQYALENSNVHHFRFVLGLQNNQIQINMVGIDDKGKEVQSISSTPYLDPGYYAKSIQSMETNPFEYSRSRKNTPVIGKHLLSYGATYDYVTKWKEVLQTKNIEELITDKGIRFRYYSLEKEVVADMIAQDNVESIALFLGLNTQNKLTTVFLQKDFNDFLIVNDSQRNGEGGGSFDFTTPCPDFCGDCKCADNTIIKCGNKCKDESKPVPVIEE